MKNLLIASLLIVGMSCHSHLFGTMKECTVSIDCGGGTSHICVHGKCVELQPAQRTFFGIVGKDICPIRCPDGTRCVNGACQAFFGSSDSQQSFFRFKPCPIACPDGTRCVNGNCITKKFSLGLDVSDSQQSYFGDVSDSHRSFFLAGQLCSTGADCGPEAVCIDGKCSVNNGSGGKCSVGAHCPNGYICVNAKCVQGKHSFFQCPIRCPDGQVCVNKRCQ